MRALEWSDLDSVFDPFPLDFKFLVESIFDPVDKMIFQV